MGFLDKLVGKDVDEFAKKLADMVAKRYPPSLDQSKEKRVSANRITKVLEDVLEQAAVYGKNHRLGVYKKARLANSFKWQLSELGYSDKFVEIATEGLVVYTTRGGAKKESKQGTQ
jgi:ATP-dependent protease HslVU (ClpYQ) ATPase subunit